MVQVIRLAYGKKKGRNKLNEYLFISFLVFCSLVCVTHTSADTAKKADVFEWSPHAITRKTAGERDVIVYEARKDNVRINKYRVSPNGEYLAIIETTGLIKNGGHRIPPRNKLIICDPEGTVLHMIDDDVRKFSWSPDGNRIAYITGSFYEGGAGFKANGIYVFDLADNGKIPIEKDFQHDTINGYSGPGRDVVWAVHDGNIYIRDYEAVGGNYMYDTKTGTTRQVSYKGIHFSPDGKYYISPEPEICVCLYESATNRDLTEETLLAIPSIPYSWMPDRSHHLLSGKTTYVDHSKSGDHVDTIRVYKAGETKTKEKRFYLYDVEKRQVVEEWVENP